MRLDLILRLEMGAGRVWVGGVAWKGELGRVVDTRDCVQMRWVIRTRVLRELVQVSGEMSNCYPMADLR